MTTSEDNEKLARRLTKEGFENENYDVIDEIIAEDYVLHDSSTPEPIRGPDGFRRMVEMGAGTVDGTIEIDQVLSTDDWVVTRWTQRGTHAAETAGIEPTNEEVTITGIVVSRVEDGKLVESWQEVNVLNMLTQIGAILEYLFSEEAPADD